MASEPSTYNELVYAIAMRARELANLKILPLRMTAAIGLDEEGAPSKAAVLDETRHLTRGQLIENILTDEFCIESDRPFED